MGSPSFPQLSVPSSALRSRCAPRRLLTCRSADRPASSRGLGTGHGPASNGVPASRAAAVELPGELPAPGPRPCRCRRRRFSTVDSSRAPAAAPRALHRPWSPASRLRRAQLSARPEAAPRRLGGAARRVPASRRHRLPLASVLPSTLQNQPTRHSGPSSREGRGGAGRGGKSGSLEEAAAARGARSWNRLFCFLEPTLFFSSFSIPCLPSRTPEAMSARPLGFLEHF